jgi:hypothetical protein
VGDRTKKELISSRSARDHQERELKEGKEAIAREIAERNRGGVAVLIWANARETLP